MWRIIAMHHRSRPLWIFFFFFFVIAVVVFFVFRDISSSRNSTGCTRTARAPSTSPRAARRSVRTCSRPSPRTCGATRATMRAPPTGTAPAARRSRTSCASASASTRCSTTRARCWLTTTTTQTARRERAGAGRGGGRRLVGVGRQGDGKAATQQMWTLVAQRSDGGGGESPRFDSSHSDAGWPAFARGGQALRAPRQASGGGHT